MVQDTMADRWPCVDVVWKVEARRSPGINYTACVGVRTSLSCCKTQRCTQAVYVYKNILFGSVSICSVQTADCPPGGVIQNQKFGLAFYYIILIKLL